MAGNDSHLAEHLENHRFVVEMLAFFDARFPAVVPFTAPVFDPHHRVTASERAGYRQAVNDVIEMTVDFTVAQLADADCFLRDRGAITLSQMKARRKRLVPQILRRGKIRTDTEYYLLNSLVSDTESPLTDDEREQINTLLAAYEARK